MKAQPPGSAPVSRDVVDNVKRKIAPPSGPPPAGMTLNFSAPKSYAKPAERNERNDDYSDNYRAGSRDHRDEDRSYKADRGGDDDGYNNERYNRHNDNRRSNDGYDNNRRSNDNYDSNRRSNDNYDHNRRSNDGYDNSNHRRNDRYDDNHHDNYRNDRYNNDYDDDDYYSGEDGEGYGNDRPYDNDNDEYYDNNEPDTPIKSKFSPGGREHFDFDDNYISNHPSNNHHNNNHQQGNGAYAGRQYHNENEDDGYYDNNNNNDRRHYDNNNRDMNNESQSDFMYDPYHGNHQPPVHPNTYNKQQHHDHNNSNNHHHQPHQQQYDNNHSNSRDRTNSRDNNTNASHSKGNSYLNAQADDKQQQQQNNHHTSSAPHHSRTQSKDTNASDVKSTSSGHHTPHTADEKKGNSPVGAAANQKIVLFNFQPILRATYRELKNFVLSPCPPGVITRCYIERNRSGAMFVSPYYSVCADLEDGTGRELMVCRKIIKSRTPHYIFSLKSEDLYRKREQRSRLYLGKLRATSANEYVLYDNGICSAPDDDILDSTGNSQNYKPLLPGETAGDNSSGRNTPADQRGGHHSDDVSLYRKELAVVHFNCKTRPAPGLTRGTEVCIPVPNSHPTLNADAKTSSNNNNSSNNNKESKDKHVINLVKPFEKIRAEKKQNELYAKTLYIMHERTSKYDPLSSCLVDFRGRANMPSVKNCQFVDSNPQSDGISLESQMKIDSEKEFVFELGKTTEDCFNMDYRYPLSLLQAFAIAISRFDAKLTW